MIKNSELYDFDKEHSPTESDPDSSSIDESNLTEEAMPPFFIKLLFQSIVTIGCLILLLILTKSDFPWAQWAVKRFHYAVNASTEDTFGWISRTKLYQSIVTNAGNLVRVEEVAKNISPENTFKERQKLTNPVWPVQGNIIKGYGWRYNENQKTREFSTGILISATPGTPVMAIADGTIIRLNHQPEQGWEVIIDHGDGWSSVYHYLGNTNIAVGQVVKTGQPIAKIGRPGQEKGPILLLEIREYEQPIDPLSVLAS